MNPLQQLNKLGQSVWYDNIERGMLSENGELVRLIKEDDLRGVTSNPAIYDKAIRSSSAYDADIEALQKSFNSPNSIFFELAVKDIQMACDLFMPVYQATDGLDGYVSLEVSPDLAHDVVGTIQEAKLLWNKINRKNAMIKVPATIEGVEAMSHLISEGININVTLIFSVKRYLRVIEGYITGLEKRAAAGKPVNHIASVASFFISRIDAAIDPLLVENGKALQGKIAIANAQKAYQHFLEHYGERRFKDLQAKGAKPQRLLWASTGTKNPAYSDVLYMDSLIGTETVNTVPPATYDAFRDHGTAKLTIMDNMADVDGILDQLASLGVSLEDVTKKLEREGIEQFQTAFNAMMNTINEKLLTL